MLLRHNIVGITLTVLEDFGDSSVEIREALRGEIALSLVLDGFVLVIVQVRSLRVGAFDVQLIDLCLYVFILSRINL